MINFNKKVVLGIIVTLAVVIGVGINVDVKVNPNSVQATSKEYPDPKDRTTFLVKYRLTNKVTKEIKEEETFSSIALYESGVLIPSTNFGEYKNHVGTLINDMIYNQKDEFKNPENWDHEITNFIQVDASSSYTKEAQKALEIKYETKKGLCWENSKGEFIKDTVVTTPNETSGFSETGGLVIEKVFFYAPVECKQ